MLGAQLAQIIRSQFRGKGAGGGIEGIVLRTVRLMGFLGRSYGTYAQGIEQFLQPGAGLFHITLGVLGRV